MNGEKKAWPTYKPYRLDVCVCVMLAEHTGFRCFLHYLKKEKKKIYRCYVWLFYNLYSFFFILLFFLVAALFFLSHPLRVCTYICLYSQVLLTLPFLIDVIEHPQGGREVWTVWEASVSISGIISPSTLTKL